MSKKVLVLWLASGFLLGLGTAPLLFKFFRTPVDTCISAQTRASRCSSQDTHSDSLSFGNFFSRESTPDWKDIRFGATRLSAPYSQEWLVYNLSLSVYQCLNNDCHAGIGFGRPIFIEGAGPEREYALAPFNGQVPPTESSLMESLGNCLLVEKTHLGGMAGYKYSWGYHGNCDHLTFTFKRGKQWYSLSRRKDSDQQPPTSFDEEMTRIIQSVYDGST